MKHQALSFTGTNQLGAKDAFHYIFCSQRGWPCER